MCYPAGDFLLGDAEIHIGDLDIGLDRQVPVHMAKSRYEYWSHTHLTIDMVPGRGAGFSLEAPRRTASASCIRSRLMTGEECPAGP